MGNFFLGLEDPRQRIFPGRIKRTIFTIDGMEKIILFTEDGGFVEGNDLDQNQGGNWPSCRALICIDDISETRKLNS